jgi:hypothetical protein
MDTSHPSYDKIDMIKALAKHLYPIDDRWKLSDRMCWEVMGEFGYAEKGEFMAYKDLMVKTAVMTAVYSKNEEKIDED